jgi:hypothetical protein
MHPIPRSRTSSPTLSCNNLYISPTRIPYLHTTLGWKRVLLHPLCTPYLHTTMEYDTAPPSPPYTVGGTSTLPGVIQYPTSVLHWSIACYPLSPWCLGADLEYVKLFTVKFIAQNITVHHLLLHLLIWIHKEKTSYSYCDVCYYADFCSNFAKKGWAVS